MTILFVVRAAMSRPAVRIINDSMSESVDLLQMLIAPPPPPPPPSTSRPSVPPHHVEESITALPQRPRVEQMCYRECHACAEEQRYRRLQQQPAECAYCSCSQPRVDPRPQCADRDDTAAIYFNPRGPLPPGASAGPGCTWPRRPPPAKERGSTVSAPRADISNTPESHCAGLPSVRSFSRRGNDDKDDCDDAEGKRTISTSLSSRSSSRTPQPRSAADICRRARCCLRCWPRRRTNSSFAAATAGDPLHQSSAADFDLCIQTAHSGHSELASAAASVGKLGRKLSLKRGLRYTTMWNIDAARRRTIILVVSFLVGLFLVSTALLTGFVLLWPSQRRRHSTSGIIITPSYVHAVC